MIELLQLLDEVLKKKLNISDFLDAVTVDALRKRASDIHIESKEDGILLVRYRIDGVLRDIITIAPELKESLLFIIKVRAKLRTDIHLAPQDGKIPFLIKKELLDKKEEKIEEETEEVVKEETKEESKEQEEIVEEKELNRLAKYKNKEQGSYNVDARVSILPVTFGEKVVIRLLTQANRKCIQRPIWPNPHHRSNGKW